MFRLFKSYFLSISVSIIIMILSLMPISPDIGLGLLDFANIDKLVHLSLYFCLSFTILYESDKNSDLKNNFIFLALILSLVYGALIELIQTTMANRSGDFLDLLADFLGSILSVPVYLLFRKFFLKKKIR